MRDIYSRKLSEKSLAIGVGNGGSKRRTSMSNSMTFVRRNSKSDSISSLFSNNENDGWSDATRRRSGEDCERSAATSSLPLPIRLNRTLTNRLTNALNSMFQCKAEEKDLSPSNQSIKISTKAKISASLIDRTCSEASDQPAQLTAPRNATLDTSNHANRCPLCLDNMSSADLAHPPQCRTSECAFNFCLECAERYISSSKDPYQKASDGSQQLKIFLRCPSCRSDLSTTLRDTVLLRHAEIVANSSDEIKLTPSDLSLQHAMSSDSFIQTAVDVAKKREETFFSGGVVQDYSPCSAPKTSHLPCQDNGTSQTRTRRHSFFYGLIEEAKQAREQKKAIEANRRHIHDRRHSVV